MPEANILFAVSGLVVAGLVVWVVLVLRFAKEPWARPKAPAGADPAPGVPVDDDARPPPSPT